MHESFDTAFPIAAMELQQSYEVERFRLIGSATQNFAIAGFGLDEPACAMSNHRVTEHVSN